MKTMTGEKLYSIDEIKVVMQNNNQAVRLAGMVHAIKDMGAFAFLTLRLSDGLLQCVVDGKEVLGDIRCECAVELCGRIRQEERAAYGLEMQVETVLPLSFPAADLPIPISKRRLNMALETELNLRPVTLRNDAVRSAFRIQSGLVQGIARFLDQNGFTCIHSPKIVSGSAEGGSNIFHLEYFGNQACLAQSPQFYKQTMMPVFGRVYEIGPVFRAEKHNTPRHLNEYVSIDLEMGFIESFDELMATELALLRHAMNHLQDSCQPALNIIGAQLPQVGEIPMVRFDRAKEMVAERYKRKIKEPYDLEPEEERLIGEIYAQEYGSDFVFITHYPSQKRPFYAMDDPQDSRFTLSFDLLFRGTEVTTGGQRIHDYHEQVEKMRRKGLDPADFEHYLMLHKYGCPPHGGLGIGLERLCMMLLGEKNIRMASLFPRDTRRLMP